MTLNLAGIALKAQRFNALAEERGIMVATAESCTGGLLSAALTEAAGASAIFDRGFVTYCDEAKQDLLGVPADTIRRHGAVSRETALAMAEGALANSNAQLAVSITGIAGPTGGSPGKPVGLVWFGVAREGRQTRATERRFGDLGRSRVRHFSVLTALGLLERGL
ncbi:CinA family protein [Marinicauda algicola]|uniref:CinA family protein n=1 Tax=Marinicauda algicola TaxID=2029849 RepID=A0A4S2GXJ9_9PROT|nr:CinA family protein [Marinicauda algicola]TGY87910.1 CinA family protein [Marinicauda algicola]